MEGEIKFLINIFLWVISSLSYCYFVSFKLPKGMYRLISILPIFYIFIILPQSLSYVITSFTTTFLLSWLANFKLFLFAFDKGPLSTDQPMSLVLFITIASLPVVIKNYNNGSSNENSQKLNSIKKLSPKIALQILILASYVSLWVELKEYIHPKLMEPSFICPLFLIIDILFSLMHVVFGFVSQLEIEPPSNEPFFSTSIQNFWGKWNIAASNILRVAIYEPTRKALSSLGKNNATYVGYLVTFLVSGLMHELLLYNVTQQATRWEMTYFFLIHGVCVVVELNLKRKFANIYRLPTFISRLWTYAFVLGTALWKFIPAVAKNNVDVRFIEEILSVVLFIKGKLSN